jgi:peptide/nickel transport system permease protein
MLTFIVRRLLQLVPVLLLLSIFVFSLIHIVPGDPIHLLMGEGHTDPVVEAALRAKYGLDQPLPVQYWTWLTNILSGDFGTSLYSNEPILNMILERFPNTLLLAIASAFVALVISIPAGIIAALYHNRLPDFAAMGVALIGISIPNFWFGILLILFFSQYLGLLPSMGYVPFFSDPLEAIRHLIMPALTLGTAMAANLTRLVRAEMIEQLSQDYVRTARAKGLGERAIVGLHVLKNAMIPTVTIIGIQFGGLLEGAVLTEVIFAWPGIGRLAVDAVYERDYALIQGVVMMAAIFYVGINLLVDISYRFLDPRVKLG